jgi:hypothetical protein
MNMNAKNNEPMGSVLIRVIRGKAFGFAVVFGVVCALPPTATRNLPRRIAQQFCRGTCFLATATVQARFGTARRLKLS